MLKKSFLGGESDGHITISVPIAERRASGTFKLFFLSSERIIGLIKETNMLVLIGVEVEVSDPTKIREKVMEQARSRDDWPIAVERNRDQYHTLNLDGSVDRYEGWLFAKRYYQLYQKIDDEIKKSTKIVATDFPDCKATLNMLEEEKARMLADHPDVPVEIVTGWAVSSFGEFHYIPEPYAAPDKVIKKLTDS